jgi:hypothetical protein
MGKNSLRIASFLFSGALLVVAWFWVLYSEENRRLAQAAKQETEYLDELRAIDSDRKAYFESIAATRKEQLEAMEAAKAQYEALLKSQADQVKAQTKATTQVVSKPVTKKETVQVAKPKSTRKSKSS